MFQNSRLLGLKGTLNLADVPNALELDCSDGYFGATNLSEQSRPQFARNPVVCSWIVYHVLMLGCKFVFFIF